MLYCKFCLLLLIVDSIAQKWMTFEANEYFYDSDPNGTVGYDQAVEICNDYNATLAIITSQEQNQFIVDDLTGKQHTSLIIGLKRLNSEAFEWQDGTRLTYTNWNETQPDGDGDCVIMIGDKWHDFLCDSPKQCVCQRSLVAVKTTTGQATSSKAAATMSTTKPNTTTTTTVNVLSDIAITIFVVIVVIIFTLLICIGILICRIKRKSIHARKSEFEMNSVSIGPHITQPTSTGPHRRLALPSSPPLTPRVSRNVHTLTGSFSMAGYMTLSETLNSTASSNAGYEVCFNSEMKNDLNTYDQIANDATENQSTENDRSGNEAAQNLFNKYEHYENLPRPNQTRDYINV